MCGLFYSLALKQEFQSHCTFCIISKAFVSVYSTVYKFAPVLTVCHTVTGRLLYPTFSQACWLNGLNVTHAVVAATLFNRIYNHSTTKLIIYLLTFPQVFAPASTELSTICATTSSLC